jgi:hypothetical protein
MVKTKKSLADNAFLYLMEDHKEIWFQHSILFEQITKMFLVLSNSATQY